jgi:hypothetical protein
MLSNAIKTDTAKLQSAEEWQMEYIARSIGVSFQTVTEAKRATGSNDRKAIEQYLRNKS